MSIRDNVTSLRYAGEVTMEKLLKAFKVNTEKERKEYQELLEEYRSSLAACQERLDTLNVTEEDHMAAVQVALDLTYIKEELDGIVGRQKEIDNKFSRIDSTIIEPIKKNYTANRTATVEKLDEVMAAVKESNKGLRTALHISLFFNIVCAGALAFIVLWILQII